MSNIEVSDHYQALTDGLDELLHDRIVGAVPVEVLSDRDDDKLLELVEEPDGQQFVRRSFSPNAVAYIERHGLSFETAWHAMQATWSGVGIEAVPSVLVPSEGEYPYRVASDYLTDLQPMTAAPTEVKQATAFKLGKVLELNMGFLPTPEMLQDGLIQVRQTGPGEAKPVVVDVDSLMAVSSYLDKPNIGALYIQELGDLVVAWCITPEERTIVVGALQDSIVDFAMENPATSTMSSMMAFAKLNTLKHGLRQPLND